MGTSCAEFGMRTLMQTVTQIFKNTAQNSQKKLAISSKKIIFSGAGPILLPRPFPQWTQLLVPSQAFWIRLCVPPQNSCHMYANADQQVAGSNPARGDAA